MALTRKEEFIKEALGKMLLVSPYMNYNIIELQESITPEELAQIAARNTANTEFLVEKSIELADAIEAALIE